MQRSVKRRTRPTPTTTPPTRVAAVRRLLWSLLLVSLLAPAGAAARVPRVPAGWIGVAADGPLLEQPGKHRGEWARMKANRVGFVRAAFVWRDLEPQAGTYSFKTTDRIVLNAAKQGLVVLPEVHGTPAWAAIDPMDLASAPNDPTQFAGVLTELVRRYETGGTFWTAHPDVEPRPIERWQVWNEQNITAYWTQQPFAERYVVLLKTAREVLDTEDPDAQLILGGMPNRSWESLKTIYDAGGKGLFDAVALHPYTGQVFDVVRVVRFVHKELVRQGDGKLPVYLTEVSWPASAGYKGQKADGFHVTEAEQASKLRSAFRALAAERQKLHIAGVIWYTWLSAEGKGLPTWSGFAGLRRLVDGKVTSAPALKVFRRTVAELRRR